MAGFDNDVLYAKNGDFTQATGNSGSESNGLINDGELWIGATVANLGGTHINVGNVTSTTLTVAYSSPNITIETMGGGQPLEEITVDDSLAPGTNPVLPTATGNINILGGPGVTTTSFAANTFTINSVIFTDLGGSASVPRDSGSFATAAITLTLPAAAQQGELLEFVCTTASALVVDAPGTDLIRIGTLVTSAGGTATSTAIGDSLTLRYRAADTTWYATSVIGTWVIA